MTHPPPSQPFAELCRLLEVDPRRREPLRAARLLSLVAAAAARPLHPREASLALGRDLSVGVDPALAAGWLCSAPGGALRASPALHWAAAFIQTGADDALRGLHAGRALCEEEGHRLLLTVAADPAGEGLGALCRAAPGEDRARGLHRLLAAALGDELPADAARLDADPEVLPALAVAAAVLHRTDRAGDAERLARSALRALERDGRLPGVAAPLLAALLQVLIEDGRHPEVRATLEGARRLAGPAAPPFFGVALLALEARSALDAGAGSEARRLFTRAELRARALGALDLVALCRLGFGALALRDGQVEAAERLCRSALELSFGHAGHEASALCALGITAIRQGRPRLARAAFDVALPQLELRFQRTVAYPNAVLADTVLGDLEGAARRVARMAEQLPRSAPGRAAVACARAFVDAAQRRSDAALQALEQVRHDLPFAPGAVRLVAAWTACRALLDRGDLAGSDARLGEAMADPAYRKMADYRCALLLLEARLALARGDLDRARRALGRVRAMPELLRAMDFSLQAALTGLGLAQAEGDEARAVGARQEALVAWETLTAELDEPGRARFGAAFGRQAARQRLLVLTPQSASPFPWLVGASPAFAAMVALLRRFAATGATVLLTGETGTGKELCARALHGLSDRRDGPFTAVNCAAVSDELLLSELFGHERGAFTGAGAQRHGYFEGAAGGTLFLDEVGELSARAQAALLRVLQDGSFARVGGTRALRADVRVVAATHRDLRAAVDRGDFREDLYYRLAGMEVVVPPLRERGADAVLLARHFLTQAALARESAPRALSQEAEELVREFAWPGNIRQLQHAVRAADLLCEERTLSGPLLRSLLRPHPSRATSAGPADAEWLEVMRGRGENLRDFLNHIQRACVLRAVEESRGNLSAAAAVLGLSRSRVSQLVNGDPAFRERVDGLVG
jgi:DNA-binding NtrC family response regulator/tetratricopeptide (TPR) repeat protein